MSPPRPHSSPGHSSGTFNARVRGCATPQPLSNQSLRAGRWQCGQGDVPVPYSPHFPSAGPEPGTDVPVSISSPPSRRLAVLGPPRLPQHRGEHIQEPAAPSPQRFPGQARGLRGRGFPPPTPASRPHSPAQPSGPSPGPAAALTLVVEEPPDAGEQDPHPRPLPGAAQGPAWTGGRGPRRGCCCCCCFWLRALRDGLAPRSDIAAPRPRSRRLLLPPAPQPPARPGPQRSGPGRTRRGHRRARGGRCGARGGAVMEPLPSRPPPRARYVVAASAMAAAEARSQSHTCRRNPP